VGAALPHRSLRGTGAEHHLLPGRHRGHAAARRHQRTRGVTQHQGPADCPPRLRIPLGSCSDRPVGAHPWRPVSAATRPTSSVNGPTAMPEDPKLVRAKSAGPFTLTFDIVFGDAATYEQVKRSGVITRELF